jgi:hypothetical protein
MDVAILIATAVLVVCIILAFIYGFRYFSQATMPQSIITPRAGVECLVVSGSDGVGVSCYPIPGYVK